MIAVDAGLEQTQPEAEFEGEKQTLWGLIQANKVQIAEHNKDVDQAEEEEHIKEGLRRTPEPFVHALLESGTRDANHAELVAETLSQVGTGTLIFIESKPSPNQEKTLITLCSPGRKGRSRVPPPSIITAYALANPSAWVCTRFFDNWVITTDDRKNQSPMGFTKR